MNQAAATDLWCTTPISQTSFVAQGSQNPWSGMEKPASLCVYAWIFFCKYRPFLRSNFWACKRLQNALKTQTSSSDWSWGSSDLCSASPSSSSLSWDLWDKISSPCSTFHWFFQENVGERFDCSTELLCTFRLRFFRFPIQKASWQLLSVSMAFTLYTNSSRLFFKAGTWLVRLVSWWIWSTRHDKTSKNLSD